jgi:hypothetical protein
MAFLIVGEDRDLLRVEDIVAVTFGDRRKYANEVDVRFWFKTGFYLDYIDVLDEDKEKLRRFFEKEGIVVRVGGRRKKS